MGSPVMGSLFAEAVSTIETLRGLSVPQTDRGKQNMINHIAALCAMCVERKIEVAQGTDELRDSKSKYFFEIHKEVAQRVVRAMPSYKKSREPLIIMKEVVKEVEVENFVFVDRPRNDVDMMFRPSPPVFAAPALVAAPVPALVAAPVLAPLIPAHDVGNQMVHFDPEMTCKIKIFSDVENRPPNEADLAWLRSVPVSTVIRVAQQKLKEMMDFKISVFLDIAGRMPHENELREMAGVPMDVFLGKAHEFKMLHDMQNMSLSRCRD